MKIKKIISFLLSFILIFVCVELAQARPESKPFPPFRIAGNLYYVGDHYQADYLIVTSQGNILINSGYEADIPKIKTSVEKLGFKFNATKVLLISHAHADHGGGSALIKKETDAKYMVMDADVPIVESGGKDDFQYGTSTDPDNHYQPTKVDRVLHDGERVKLGSTVLVAHHTGGHTKGCTTWTMRVVEKGKAYNVVIVGGPYVNPGYKLVHNTAYPTIAKDYEHTFKMLKSLPCDIFLGAHGMYFDLEKKYALMKQGKKNSFVDPAGYKKFIALKEQDFRNELVKQKSS
ncbi:MAG: subclass B3 metallo-beta-lactamase [Gammaproteobacteria bacterium]|nr:subclass B3 metallo-beta-lactamase [Gammaproteobacteria bacterium]